jgi:hypothetical protein
MGHVSLSFDWFIEQNQRQLDEHVHGQVHVLETGDALSNVAPIATTVGISKIMIVANAGGTPTGVVTVTGTTVDRDTGVETPADTENITFAGLSTDTSDTDAEGNVRHGFAGAYVTSKWFRGAITISTAAGQVVLTDTDVYQLAFEQFNDNDEVTVDAFDLNTLCNNTAGWLYAYLYSVVVTGQTVAVARIASLNIDIGDSDAGVYYRLRRKDLGVVIDGTTDGIFANFFFGPTNQNYWDDISMKIWRELDIDDDIQEVIDANAAAAAVADPVLKTARQVFSGRLTATQQTG